MTYARVKDKKTGVERTVTAKAYRLIPHRYTLLGYEDENGNPVGGPEAPQQSTQKKRNPAAPAVSERPKLTPEEIEDKKAELRAMNQVALDNARKQQEEAAKGESLTGIQQDDLVTIKYSNKDAATQESKPDMKPEQKKRGPKPKAKS